jgi:protein-S-isoprenylcysteine O-methyltransferase Ste14
VRLGWLFGVAALLLARPQPRSLLLALPLVALGEAIRVWASGHIDKTRALATGGPYAHTRNPLYFGSLLLGAGVAVAAWSPWTALAVALYLAAYYPRAVREEAAFLARRFGADYAAWAQEVPLFLPRTTPAGPRATRFDWLRVRRNREWRTALALPALLLLLWLRSRLPIA